MSRRTIAGIALLLLAGAACAGLTFDALPMQRFIIERDIPGAGRMSAAERQAGAAKSNDVLRSLGSDIQPRNGS